jgi:DNA-binding NtrC family response regulator
MDSPFLPVSLASAHSDSRPGLHTLVQQFMHDLHRAQPPVDVAALLSSRLQSMAPVRQVTVTTAAGASPIRVGHPVVSHDYAAFSVPTRDQRGHVLLEARFAPHTRPDAPTCQLLEGAACLAALVVDGAVAAPPASKARPQPSTRDEGVSPLVGSSAVMQALRDRVARVASTDFTILIEGDSGSGKELVARQIHQQSRRAGGPFVAINCAALVETLLEAELFGIEERTATGVKGRRGKFEYADGGTLFLDEVSDLSLSAQAKLLRAIQDLTVERVGATGGRRVDVRIVAATNRALSGLVANGLFRADLFYRLSGVEVQVPALRQRKGDLLDLVQHFLVRHQARGPFTMSAAATDALLTYDWPGNVRELERMMEGAVAVAEQRQIQLDDLPACLRGDYAEVLMPSVSGDHTMRAWGSRYARLILERARGNKREACRRLGISYHTLNAYLAYKGPRRRLILDSAGAA